MRFQGPHLASANVSTGALRPADWHATLAHESVTRSPHRPSAGAMGTHKIGGIAALYIAAAYVAAIP
jgi:hypothetical protein